jgi:hypothetical protein
MVRGGHTEHGYQEPRILGRPWGLVTTDGDLMGSLFDILTLKSSWETQTRKTSRPLVMSKSNTIAGCGVLTYNPCTEEAKAGRLRG